MRALGLFAIAAAIAFFAWWPSYKVEHYVAECVAPAIAKVTEAAANLDKAKEKADAEQKLYPMFYIRSL